jgi:hypothetical protein
VFLILDVGS